MKKASLNFSLQVVVNHVPVCLLTVFPQSDSHVRVSGERLS